MLMLIEIDPSPAKKLVGYRCDKCGRELLFANSANAEELLEMTAGRLDADAYGVSRAHVCRNCRLNLKITGVPENQPPLRGTGMTGYQGALSAAAPGGEAKK